MYEFANYPADETANEFGSQKPLILWGRAGHPAPADEGEIGGEAASDPSLPTT